jgi:hypothetical protein
MANRQSTQRPAAPVRSIGANAVQKRGENEGKNQTAVNRRRFSGGLLRALGPSGHPPVRSRSLSDAPGIRPRARPDLSNPGVFHRRRHFRVRLPGRGAQILRRPGQQNSLLLGGLGVRDHSGGLLLHGAAAFRGHLHPGRRHWTGRGLSVFRPGHQRAGHFHDRKNPGLAIGPGPWAPSSSR